MRIVIDLQGAQTESRFRGIGRYSLSLTQAIVRNRGDHEVIIALSGLFPDTIEPIRAAFDGLLSQENIRVWHAHGPVRECEPGNRWRREAAELIREAFLASLQPDVIHITSLFEGFVDDAVTSIGHFDHTTLVSVSLYDLIPLLNVEQYLASNPAYEQYYLRKIDYLRRSSLLLAISNSSKQEGVKYLDRHPKSLVNISTAADDCFRPLSLSEEEVQILRDKFCLTRPFVLYSGGADERKNLPRLIRAYAQLPVELRNAHQLVFAGNMPEDNVYQLQQEAKSAGLCSGELVFTGYVSDDELVKLYNLCKLYAFPSWHEGFGLPALEAMSCGTPVIGANTSSLPEVIGNVDALFDPFSEEAITEKLAQALSNEVFRLELKQYGYEQAKKFSWDDSATKAISAMEQLYIGYQHQKSIRSPSARRPKLAYISPLPPERSGISDYGAELLPELSRHYDIEVIVAQDLVSDPWVNANCPVRSVEWFKVHAADYERTLYHIGNSPFHEHMLQLMIEFPGAVVLHDFFINNIQYWQEMQGDARQPWLNELYHAHGYIAVEARIKAGDLVAIDRIKAKYPCNLSVIQNAQGIIVHSEESRRLAKQWYGNNAADDWVVVPLLRAHTHNLGRAESRAALSLGLDDFVICSFGLLDSTKLNHRLLNAWLASELASDSNCVLVFVGENHAGKYGQELLSTICQSDTTAQRIRIAGWVDMATYRQYLNAADLGIQLRTLSRGETSAAVLDCMNYGLATIVNANGSMADLPHDAVLMLPDDFEDNQLVEAMEALWEDGTRRAVLSEKAREVVQSRHVPGVCADQYFQAIEEFNAKAQRSTKALIQGISSLDSYCPSNAECAALAQSISQSLPVKQPAKQLLVDVSATCHSDLKTGIERVVRGLIMALLKEPPVGYRVEPVYLSSEGGKWHYRYARRYTLGLLECPPEILVDEVVESQNGDLILGVDISGQMLVEAHESGLFDRYKNSGVAVYFVVYDLLPVLLPQFFPPGTDVSHAKWLQTVVQLDGAVCISKAVAIELRKWSKTYDQDRLRPFKIGWFNLGADVESTAPTLGLPNSADSILSCLAARPTFLMVGTVEPRKGYLQAIEAFTLLWDKGEDINLVIVGKEGWKELPIKMRRTVPEILNKLCSHKEFDQRLFWLKDVSDEYLDRLYDASTCLIAASEGEGFGLPLIEAAQHKLPVIARNIPVFREVAGTSARYFKGNSGISLADGVREFMTEAKSINAQPVQISKQKTWKDSAASLMSAVVDGKWKSYIVPQSVRKIAIDEHLNLIHKARVQMISTLLPPGDIVLDLGGANAPLYQMGYPHRFEKLVLIDLPPEDRHDYYKEIVIDTNCDGGEVIIKYNDMTQLEAFENESVDLVWSGQSIEHVSYEAGKRMCESAYRVLRKGGAFCLDTPNRLLTEIHTRDVGGGFIHPEHCIEYAPEQLAAMLQKAGFIVKYAYGICEMQNTSISDEFCYEDFIYGQQITSEIEKGYILFYHCVKP